MRNRVISSGLFLSIVVLLSLVCLPRSSESAAPALARRVVLISWDGGADWVIDKLLAEGKLPNLARMVRSGVRADSVITAFPSVTAPSHAALWTGAWSDRNGISNNSIPLLPRSAHTVLEQDSGFDPSALQAEPIWMTAAIAGKHVVSLAGPQQHPAKTYLDRLRSAGIPEDRYISLNASTEEIAPSGVIGGDKFAPASGWTGIDIAKGRARESSFKLGDATFYILAFDSPGDSVDGFDTVRICPMAKSATNPECVNLKPAEASNDIRQWSKPFRVTKGDLFDLAYFRLFALSADGSQMVLYLRGTGGFDSSAPQRTAESYLTAAGGLEDSGAFDVYSAGQLGPTLWNKGDGAAERRLMEIVRLDMEFLKRGTRFALDKLNPDLLLHYTPSSDSAGHLWMGALDPESLAYQPELAAKLQPFYEQVFELQDAWLGSVLDAAGKDSVVSLSSDHGMSGVGKMLFPNFVFQSAGLLSLTPDGKIDLARTKILAPPWARYFVSLNSTDWKGGIVVPADREDVLKQAEDALLAVTDPDTGRHVVTKIFRSGEAGSLGVGGPGSGDLYLDVAAGYGESSDVFAKAIGKVISAAGAGVHGALPLHPKMQAIWYAAGPGLAQGRTIGTIRQIDVAPTLCFILGIPAPRESVGHILGDALEK